MVDTVRSVTELQTLLADNDIKGITAQRLRDFLVTSLGVFGSIYLFEGITAQLNPDTGAKLVGFNANGTAKGITPDHTTDSLTVPVAGFYDFNFQCSFTGTANALFRFRLRVNQVEQPFGCERSLNASGDVGSASFVAPGIQLQANDVVEVWVEANTAIDDLTPVDMQLSGRLVG